MASQYVDRSELLRGSTKTPRDFKVPYNKVRSLQNFSLPDSRARRRAGFKQSGDKTAIAQQLTKVSPTFSTKLFNPSRRGKQELIKTPLSYGLIRHVSDLKPTSVNNWSIELTVTLGDHELLVTDPFDRKFTVGAGGSVRKTGVYILDWALLSNNHTFNDGTIDSPGTDRVLTADHSGGNQSFDVFPLSTLSILFTKTHLKFSMDLVEKTGGNKGRYWPEEIGYDYAFPTGDYVPGDSFHIAITYSAAGGTGELKYYINGVEEYDYTIDDTTLYEFVGAYDYFNGVEHLGGMHRDIVLLNECTVRGSYASACKIQRLMHGHMHLYHDDASNLEEFNMPWCCSPPVGTAIRDLRFYDIERSVSSILAEKDKTLLGTETDTPLANWRLNSGSGLNFDTINKRVCSLHHTYPQYLIDNDLSNKVGIHFSDGQYIALETIKGEESLVKDVAVQLKNCFGYDGYPRDATDNVDSKYGYRRIQARHDFTVQTQIRTPPVFQSELNAAETGGTLNTEQLVSADGSETRLSMSGSVALSNMDNYALRDGFSLETYSPVYNKVQLGDHAGDTTLGQFTRAYDSTIFSVEASSVNTSDDSDGDKWNVPLARGLITPSGKVAFEVSLTGDYPDSGDPTLEGQEPRFIRIVSSTTLTADKVYDIQFVKRATDRKSFFGYPTGIQLEIWIGTKNSPATSPDVTWKRVSEELSISSHTVGNPHLINFSSLPSWLSTGDTFQLNLAGVTGTAAGSLNADHVATVTGATQVSVPVNTTALTVTGNGVCIAETKLRSSPIIQNENFKVVFGATGIKDAYDRSIGMPVNTSPSVNGGPWSVGKVYMSPYQSQPGFFTLGRARMWTKSLSTGELSNIPDFVATRDSALIVNVDPTEVTGCEIPNITKYSANLLTGYSAWGSTPGGPYTILGSPPYGPELLRVGPVELAGSGSYVDPVILMTPACMIPDGWSMSDCLGYTAILDSDDTSYIVPENLEINGLLPFQTTLTKQFGLMSVAGSSMTIDKSLTGDFQNLYPTLLSEFSSEKRWRGVSIGDRTIITSQSGVPRSYDGKNFTTAGFKRYDGPKPLVRARVISTSGSITAGSWIGIRLVYLSESRAIQHISDLSVALVDTNNSLILGDIHSHPDPRVTRVVIYRTREQASEILARSAEMFPTVEYNLSNSYVNGIKVTEGDTDLIAFPLDLRQDPLPCCEFATSVRDRVWFAGDLVIPDAVYYTDAGNPEKIDILNNRIVLEGGGDRVTGLSGIFGTVFVFKSNSLWRIDENRGTIQVEKIADTGAVSEDSIVTLSDPDSGATLIFYWSQHGPYVFDGRSNSYIGYDIEDKETPGAISAEFTWLDPTSVLVMHDVRNREVICFYKPKNTNNNYTRRTEAVVYNYRFRSWYRYTGFGVESVLSQSFSGQEVTGYGNSSYVPEDGEIINSQVTLYNAYLGGTNGKVFEWGRDTHDGIPQGDYTDYHTVSSYSPTSYVVTLAGGGLPLKASGYRHLSATIYRPENGDYYTVPVVDNTATTVTLSPDFDQISFDPESGDRVYLAFPPASIEFPWDNLGLDFVNKEIKQLVTWHNKNFSMKLTRNWDDELYSIRLKTLSDVSGKRAMTTVNARVEAAKLTLTSLEAEASLDAYGYTVEPLDKPSKS